VAVINCLLTILQLLTATVVFLFI